ncbi:hypothetical protein Q0812_02745 [Brevundimonas sp. 2R-24]|uniref:DUF1570 domain-containing protein n=1 Tax=Peiella sedimenti TaxID=3061083 RepID=A0ABT8SIE4_9CAUL|nr:hypothetical protein [Caulobacteraceae bacterium XZ-24]
MLKLLRAALIAVAVWAGLAGAAEARWLRAESPRFIVYSNGDERVLREYVAKLETFDTFLRNMHGIPEDRPVERKLPIYLVADEDELRLAAPGLPRGVGGFYRSGVQDAFAIGRRTRGDDAILLHEYVHHFMLHHFPDAYPGWLVEGYAEYYMSADVNPRAVRFGTPHQGRVDGLRFGNWISFRDLLTKRPGELASAEDRSMFYSQAWLLTHYFLSDSRRKAQLAEYVRSLRNEGADPVQAMEEATGQPIDELSRLVRQYSLGDLRYQQVSSAGYRPPEPQVTELPASADALLLARLSLSGPVDDDQKAARLAEIRSLAAPHAGDRVAELTLARAELVLGAEDAAGERLEAWIAAHPEDPEALEMLAERLIQRQEPGDIRRASQLLGQAHQLDGSRYQTLYHLGRLRERASDYPTENDLNIWLLALQLAPQVGEVRLRTAEAVLRSGRADLAERMVGVLVNNPHGGGLVQAARDLQRRARAAQGRTEPDAAEDAPPEGEAEADAA